MYFSFKYWIFHLRWSYSLPTCNQLIDLNPECTGVSQLQSCLRPYSKDNTHHSNKARNATLYAAALTCKILQEPALNALWKSHHSLLPLLKTFPKDSWLVAGQPNTFVRSFNRVPIHTVLTEVFLSALYSTTASDWGRFYFYAKRIRRLALTSIVWPNEYGPTVSHVLELSMDTAQHPRPLLVNLQNLAYYECH